MNRQEICVAEIITAMLIMLLAILGLCLRAFAGPVVDMSIIARIESSGNPLAYNSTSQARGLYQITPVCLEDYNNYHPGQTYTLEELFNPVVNEIVACWYLFTRIPQLLRYYDQPVTTDNILVGYNAGIGRVGRKLPSETANYLEKYKKLLNNR